MEQHLASMPSSAARFKSLTKESIRVCKLAESGAYRSEGSTVQSIRVVYVCLIARHFSEHNPGLETKNKTRSTHQPKVVIHSDFSSHALVLIT